MVISLRIPWDFQLQEEYTRWEAASLSSSWSIPMFHADFPGFTLKIVEHSPYLLVSTRSRSSSGLIMSCSGATMKTEQRQSSGRGEMLSFAACVPIVE
jgi:hypothetical protein